MMGVYHHDSKKNQTTNVCAVEIPPSSSSSSARWQSLRHQNFLFSLISTLLLAGSAWVVFRKKFALSSRAAAVNRERQATDQGKGSATTHTQQQQQRKAEFLKRAGSDYGYGSSLAGFIDDWRKKEFPNMIGPISLTPEVGAATKEPENTHATTNPSDNDNDEVYLDYAGAALPSRSLLTAIHEESLSGSSILGNPHSSGPAASRTSRLIEQAKKEVLDHFNGHPGRLAAVTSDKPASAYNNHGKASNESKDLFYPGYDIVFTSGTTEALRIVAERFPWSNGNNSKGSSPSLLVYPHNAHTSIVGMRGPALASGGNFLCKQLDDIMQIVQDDKRGCSRVGETLQQWKKEVAEGGTSKQEYQQNAELTSMSSVTRNLLVLPAECNFGGDRPDVTKLLQMLRRRQENGSGAGEQWSTMLDLAKAACTGPVNLRELDPDFACVSFYKMFGVPTGLGALFVRRTATALLLPTTTTENYSSIISKSLAESHHRYFGGGSVDVVLSGKDFMVGRNLGQSSSSVASDTTRPSSLASLTQGTVHFRGIAALPFGFRELHRLGGMQMIQRHTDALAQELVRRLTSLRHGNGVPVIVIYGAWGEPGSRKPGPVVTFSIRRWDGTVVGYNEVTKLGALNQPPIQLRGGCFCNPGACQKALKMSDTDIVENYTTSGHVCGDAIDSVNGSPTGLCRVSLGKDSVWEDLDAWIIFIAKHYLSKGRKTSHTSTSNRSNAPTKAKLVEIFLYPIKSCAGQRVKRWKMDLNSGRLQYDREFALVDSFGTALRLQKFPKMGFIRPRVDSEKGTLRVSAPGMPDLTISLEKDQRKGDTTSVLLQGAVSVCGNKCSGKLWGELESSEWFSSYLGVQCWLARYDDGRVYTRSSEASLPEGIPKRINDKSRHSFSNEKPLLLISKHAVDQLNENLRGLNQPSVSAKHFRPNLVVECLGRERDETGVGCHPEDTWESISVSLKESIKCSSSDSSDKEIQLSACGLCARCAMVDVDPTSGTKGKTLRALADYRRGNTGEIHFGIFLEAKSPYLNEVDNYGPRKPREAWLDEGCLLVCQ